MFVIAPFSNDDIRDWPVAHYATLIGLLVAAHPDRSIRVVGSPSQRLRACEIVRPFDAGRVVSDCGRAAWPEVVERVARAACVIGNNSGIAHLAARLGRATVCIFGGSHQREMWRPLGPAVAVVSRAIGCAPCHLHLAASCPYGKACLSEIEPEAVVDAVGRSMALAARGAMPC